MAFWCCSCPNFSSHSSTESRTAREGQVSRKYNRIARTTRFDAWPLHQGHWLCGRPFMLNAKPRNPTPYDPEPFHQPRRTTPSVSLGSCCLVTCRCRGNLGPCIPSCRSRASGASDTHGHCSAASRHSVGQRLLHLLVSSRARKNFKNWFFRSQATCGGTIFRALVRGDFPGHLCSCWRPWAFASGQVGMRNDHSAVRSCLTPPWRGVALGPPQASNIDPARRDRLLVSSRH